jgi:CubicO group peptidase (beta-lactamase class C family)
MKQFAVEKAIEFIDAWLDLRYKNLEIPGFSVALSQNDKIIFEKSYGFANIEKKEKLTTEHIFRIASHSKTFTATSIMQLQESGKLRIDDYIVDYLPWLKDHDDKRWKYVTIRQILSHGAGIIRDGEDADYWALEREFPDAKTLRDEIMSTSLVLDNNTKLKYSNYGYSLLGMLIEQVSGIGYKEYVTQNIINPLKLKNTYADHNESIHPQLVTGYSLRINKLPRLPITKKLSTNAMASATGFCSTASDLCHYFNTQIIGSNKLLSDESKKEMQRLQWQVKNSSQEAAYGLGLDIGSINEKEKFGHSGGFPGQVTDSVCVPEDKLVAVVLTNGQGTPAEYIANSILRVIFYFDSNMETAPQLKNTEKFSGVFINRWGYMQVVPLNDKKLVAIYPDSWEPFKLPEELEYVDERTLKITKANSFSSEGERIIYDFGSSGTAKFIRYAGSKMWPVPVFINKMKTLKEINLP